MAATGLTAAPIELLRAKARKDVGEDIGARIEGERRIVAVAQY